MKLRNKKNGFIGYIEYNLLVTEPRTGDKYLTVRYKDDSGITCYKYYWTIEEFNKDWEDYKSAKLYIEDEKIRKFVRYWAILNKIKDAAIEKKNFIDCDYIKITGYDKYGRDWIIEIQTHSGIVIKDYKENIVPITKLVGEI